MQGNTQVEQLAAFAQAAAFDDLSNTVLDRLKLHLLDTLGCAMGALGTEPTQAVRRASDKLGGSETGPCSLIGGGRAAIDRATLVNGSLVRYLDFMDNFLAPKQTCHPCDTFAAVLAAAEAQDLSGRDFPACLAMAYQVFCRLIEEAPVQDLGFDHTVQLAYGVAAGTKDSPRHSSRRCASTGRASGWTLSCAARSKHTTPKCTHNRCSRSRSRCATSTNLHAAWMRWSASKSKSSNRPTTSPARARRQATNTMCGRRSRPTTASRIS